MRIAVGGFQHETNTFAATRATWADFCAGGAWPPLVRGAALVDGVAGINLPITGAIEALRAAGAAIVPLAWSAASPSAHVTADAFERMAALIVATLLDAGPVDGVYLDLHGAMVTEHCDDGEGELLARVRAVVGDAVPVVASLDLHANVTARMVAAADLLEIYRTYPHVDMDVTGGRAARALVEFARGRTRPSKAFRQLPFLVPMTWGCTLIEPARSLYALLDRPARGGATASLAMGFPAADIADCGPSVVAYAETDDDADALADELAAAVLAREADFAGRAYSADEAVARAMASGCGPVVLADTQDNPGGGADADTTWILAALIRHRAQRAVVGVLHDPAAAAAAHAAGVGATIDVALGARCVVPGHRPLCGPWRVERLGDGAFTGTGPMFVGARMQLGPMALLEHGGVRAIVASKKAQAADQSMFRHLGVEPREQAIVVVKSSVHFRNDFQPIAREILVVEAPGPMVLDPSKLPFTRLRPGVRRAPCAARAGG